MVVVWEGRSELSKIESGSDIMVWDGLYNVLHNIKYQPEKPIGYWWFHKPATVTVNT